MGFGTPTRGRKMNLRGRQMINRIWTIKKIFLWDKIMFIFLNYWSLKWKNATKDDELLRCFKGLDKFSTRLKLIWVLFHLYQVSHQFGATRTFHSFLCKCNIDPIHWSMAEEPLKLPGHATKGHIQTFRKWGNYLKINGNFLCPYLLCKRHENQNQIKLQYIYLTWFEHNHDHSLTISKCLLLSE